MPKIVNYHVIDPRNIGDLYSSPLNYFDFPGYEVSKIDIRTLDEAKAEDDPENLLDHHAIVGGGGLMFGRFLNHFQRLQCRQHNNRLILWGAGQQVYQLDRVVDFDYTPYLQQFDQIGIRDFNQGYAWVPCVSCMHELFDRSYPIEHEFVVFSHKKFQVELPQLPRLTNESDDFEKIIRFLASGETIITSSFHGAYWGTLLGRKVLGFPFTSKFMTLKHSIALYPVEKWRQAEQRLQLFGKTIYQRFDKHKFVCNTGDWQSYLRECVSYPESLEECRDRNRLFYQQVMDVLVDE